ncbi:antitoxin Xre/MbcA/ParS toxin-binding domain-containing protein [Acidihalobacter ferrooxydans]|uniref:Uncharacterized protein n=1 Tax=Acidihalobacter ferrooxydans TaxID=1765967 RepID=A0A1P8UDQ2_9GAMM|nr:antitoxin Xre/MbcA/ParS toxin-binding domain-containing protein [Acidihalobacter ferrooxydans]APZ41975.1 hypothetical protein BW247_01745 [Acidihalobacter ferrooxydans]
MAHQFAIDTIWPYIYNQMVSMEDAMTSTTRFSSTPDSDAKRRHFAFKASPRTFFDFKEGVLQLPKALVAWKMIREGLEFHVVEAVAEHLDTDLEVVLQVIGLTGGTVTRRKKANLLNPQESDRLYRVLKVTALAERVLENPQKAKAWLLRNNRALGGQSPFSLLDNEAGTEAVEDLLIQIDHGVYS